MNAEQEVEKKLGMSLDELIASQAKKKASGKPKTGGGARVKKALGPQKVQTKGGGRVLVVPRPKHVPRPSSAGGNFALKGTRGGGVHKGSSAPKFYGGGGGGMHMGGPMGRQASNRNVKVTIGNKLSGRAPSHIPTSGVLAKPFMGAAATHGSGSGRAPMMLEGGSGPTGYGGGRAGQGGGSLSSRFDSMGDGAPSGGVSRPSGVPRRNAHGVLIP